MMEIMASSNWNLKADKEPTHCLLRGKKLSSRPEELMRQRVVQEMITVLGFPKAWLAIEVSLQAICEQQSAFLVPVTLPNRRVDIVAYAQNPSKEHGGLVPLLLIECKAGPFTARGWRQLLGYQYHVRAACIAMLTPEGCYLHALSDGIAQGKPICVSTLPSFDSLCFMRASQK